MKTTVEIAAEIAHRAHTGQYRRDGATPYIEHPRAVATRVAGDELAVAAAWLHDVLEDSTETPEALTAAGLPGEVVQAVVCLSIRRGESYGDFLDRVAANPLARKIKVADLLSNLADQPTTKQIRKCAKALLRLVEG